MNVGISPEASEIYAASEVIDIHVESFVWTRILGYNLSFRHGRGILGGRLYSQFDLPRMVEASMSGAVLSVATNPLRRAPNRPAVLASNLARLRRAVAAQPEVALVSGTVAFRVARAAGKAACFVAVQGGNAIDPASAIDQVISRVTLVHLTDSSIGATSSPLGLRRTDGGLKPAGRDLVQALNERRVLVDLAHISRRGFDDALAVHDRSQPAIVSHTGAAGVHPSWRNVDDDQIRAIASTGGVVGIMYHRGFLGRPSGSVTAATVVRHIEHVIGVGGEDCAALGSDWDGLIVTPRDMPTVHELPVLVQRMLDRRFTPERISKVLGGNYLRVMESVRP